MFGRKSAVGDNENKSYIDRKLWRTMITYILNIRKYVWYSQLVLIFNLPREKPLWVYLGIWFADGCHF